MTAVEQNKTIMRRMIEEVWNQGNLLVADELFHADHVSPSAPDLPKGPDSVKMLVGMFRGAMPDYQMTIDMLTADEHKVVGRFTQSGTHIGAPLMGMEPSGRRAEWTEIGVLEIENGMIIRSWYEVDMLSMMQQLNPQPAGETTPLTADDKRAIIGRLYDETNKGNVDVLYELLADDFISHGGGGLPDTIGPQGLIDLAGMFMQALPDLQFEVLQVVAEGDYVSTRGMQRATHKGNFMGMAPATGNQVEWSGTATFRFNSEGKIAERWVDMDSLSLFQQLGIVPSFGAAGG